MSVSRLSTKQEQPDQLPSDAVHQKGNDHKMAEIYGDPVPDVERLTLWDILYNGATQYQDCEAIVSAWQCVSDLTQFPGSSCEQLDLSGADCLRYTFRELLVVVNRLAEALHRRGVKPGMRVAAVLWNSADWGVWLWVAARMDLTFIPIDPRDSEAARKMLATVESDILVVQSDSEQLMLQDKPNGLFDRLVLQIQCQGSTLEGWLSMYGLLSTGVTLDLDPAATRASPDTTGVEMQDADVKHVPLPPPLILFTSGTMGDPKACVHSHKGLVSQTYSFDPNEDKSVRDRWLINTPVSHIFAINNAIRAWTTGGAAVFPSRSFDVSATLQALVREKITIMSATPTLVRALLAQPDFPDKSELSISLVTLAATAITEADVKLCRDALGAEHAIQAYGLTEGAPLISCRRTDPMYQAGWHEGVGKVLPGAAVRICRPRSREVLQRGEIGELHAGGTSLFSQYLNSINGDESCCYRDDSGEWLATGDQAMIDNDGIVHLMGRYKEMIIRGGENIHPLRIEAALSVLPGLQAQVIGVPDDIAGQLPVAIVELPENVTKEDVWNEAAKLGPRYALKSVITLGELGLECMPRTSLGKVKKELLKDAAAVYLAEGFGENRRSLYNDNFDQQLLDELMEHLTESWERITGVRPGPTETLSTIADSITLLRFCDHVLRQTGHRIYLPDVVLNQTVQKQAELLCARSTATSNGDSPFLQNLTLQGRPSRALPRTGVPIANVMYGGSAGAWESEDVERATSTLTLAGVGGDHLEDTIPLRTSMSRMVKGQRPQSYHLHFLFKAQAYRSEQIVRGLKAALTHHPLLRTLVQTNRRDWTHVVAKPSPLLWQKLVQSTSIDSEEEARSIHDDGSARDHMSTYMFRAEVIHVRKSDTTFVSLTFNHSVVDAMYLLSWHWDLDNLIRDPDYHIPPRVPFKAFADLLWQYEESRAAKSSVDFQVRRLRGISRCEQSLWPTSRSPGWMIGNDADSELFEERQHARNAVWNGEWEARGPDFIVPRRGRVVHLPNIEVLHRKHGVNPCIYAMSALVLFNSIRTKTGRAIFSTWESGRSWPFVPPWVEKALPSVMDVNGPTFEWILHMFEVDESESLLEFLQRMSKEREETMRYQHAPWHKVVEELRDEGPVAMDASFRQSFVWDVSIGLSTSSAAREDFKSLKLVSRYDWPDCGIFWNAFMVSEDSMFFVASWDTAHMNDVEIDECCDLYASVLRRLGSPENWDETIGSIFKS